MIVIKLLQQQEVKKQINKIFISILNNNINNQKKMKECQFKINNIKILNPNKLLIYLKKKAVLKISLIHKNSKYLLKNNKILIHLKSD